MIMHTEEMTPQVGRKKNRPSTKSWDEQKALLKSRFPKLLDEDLDFDIKQKSEMLTKLEFKLALTKVEIQAIIE